MSISSKLNYIKETKNIFADVLIEKGETVDKNDTFRSYAYKFASIKTPEKIAPTTLTFSEYAGTELDLSFIDTSRMTSFGNLFNKCENLKSLDVSHFNTQNVTAMQMTFARCNSLEEVKGLENWKTPKLTNISYMFNTCSKIKKVDFSSFDSTNITSSTETFNNCSNLVALIINNPNVFNMPNVNMLAGNPIKYGTGYIYVPDDLVETYKSATNWSTYADQIKGISELPNDEEEE